MVRKLKGCRNQNAAPFLFIKLKDFISCRSCASRFSFSCSSFYGYELEVASGRHLKRIALLLVGPPALVARGRAVSAFH